MQSFNTCRFCKKAEYDHRKLVKYGVRHEAHHACYLDAGKKLADLHAWQVANFPMLVLKQRGLLAEAERIVAAEKQRERAEG
jgi:hypothetical protein